MTYQRPPRDALGELVPDRLHEPFRAASAIKVVLTRSFRRTHSNVYQALRRLDVAELETELSATLSALLERVKTLLPYARCPKCRERARPPDASCICLGREWVSKTVYHEYVKHGSQQADRPDGEPGD